ncbi:hypothetical protein L9F63_025665, partial [Diploptera punctata]
NMPVTVALSEGSDIYKVPYATQTFRERILNTETQRPSDHLNARDNADLRNRPVNARNIIHPYRPITKRGICSSTSTLGYITWVIY